MERRANFSGLLGETMSLIIDGAKGFGLFIVVVGGIEAAGASLSLAEPGSIGEFSRGFRIEPDTQAAEAIFQLVSSVVTIIGSYFLLAHLLAVRGRLADTRTHIWAYLGMNILSGLAIILGLILLIVPGIILAIRWTASSGFLIGNGMGVTQSLSASWQATRGHSWPIAGAALAIFAIVMVGAVVLGAVAGISGSSLVVNIATGLSGGAVSAAYLAFGIATYHLVHSDADGLGEVFS